MAPEPRYLLSDIRMIRKYRHFLSQPVLRHHRCTVQKLIYPRAQLFLIDTRKISRLYLDLADHGFDQVCALKQVFSQLLAFHRTHLLKILRRRVSGFDDALADLVLILNVRALLEHLRHPGQKLQRDFALHAVFVFQHFEILDVLLGERLVELYFYVALSDVLDRDLYVDLSAAYVLLHSAPHRVLRKLISPRHTY